jgi:hypothetical protein
MILAISLAFSIIINIGLGIFSYAIFVRKRSYKKAFHRNVERCKKILENERKYKELSKSINGIFSKLRTNAKEQVQLVDQANTIIMQEDDLTQEMIEISGNFQMGISP